MQSTDNLTPNTHAPQTGRVKSARRSSAFLVELLIVVLFFSIASAVTIKLFVAAHDKSVSSQELVNAVAQSQSVAEAIKATDSPEQALSLLYRDKVASTGEMQAEIFFDENWQVVGNPSSYKLTVKYSVTPEGAGEMLTAEIITYTQDNKLIYALNISDYILKE
ncbi:MAG TPA: type II secretion system protein [Oscillospiraceae bacterium]|nr:type II secretion system protein [Oscillospiraceae bacterium]